MDPVAAWLAALRDALERGVLAKLVLAAPTSPEGPRRIEARRVRLRAGSRVQLVAREPGRDRTRNLPDDEAVAEVEGLLGAAFRAAHLHTTERTLQLEWRKGAPRLTEGPSAHAEAPAEAHDRAKKRVIEPDPRWLAALGVTGPAGRPTRGMEGKLRQIHRFVEVLDHLLDGVPSPGLRVVDLGCGRGTLTFATWQYLRDRGWRDAEVVGIELRPALAAKAEGAARSLGAAGLSFRAGSIAETDLGRPDVVVALHACDTATDDALARGIEAGARLLLAAPCCHKEVRPQLAAPAALGPVLRHGILRTREAEIATDALRAALLEVAGYDARVFEFVSTEHTDKNLMIAAVRRPAPVEGALDRARALAAFYGIGHQRLADRLGLRPRPESG